MSTLSNLLELIKVSIFPPKQQDFDRKKLGLNAFFNKPELGTIDDQVYDIHGNLGVNVVRVLFNWNDAIQPSKNEDINFSFYDLILSKCTGNLKALVVLNGCPNWLDKVHDSGAEFLKYIEKVGKRYSDNQVVYGYEIGNEPNQNTRENQAYGFYKNPAGYIKILSKASQILKSINSNKLVTNASTTSIIQDYPRALKYNKELVKLGIQEYIDVFSFHYYGNGYTNLLRPGGVLEFLSEIKIPLYITEIGSQTEHLKYSREKIPYLCKKLPRIAYYFWYQYDGDSPNMVLHDQYGRSYSYGLRIVYRNSDLYYYLKKNK